MRFCIKVEDLRVHVPLRFDVFDSKDRLLHCQDGSAYFSDRGRWFQRDRGRRFTVIVDGRGCAQATGFIVTQSSMMV